MDTFGIIRGATRLVVSAGVGAVVKNAINHTTPANLGRVKKALVGVGSFAISGMVSEIAAAHIVKHVDDIQEKVNEHRDVIEKAKEGAKEIAASAKEGLDSTVEKGRSVAESLVENATDEEQPIAQPGDSFRKPPSVPTAD